MATVTVEDVQTLNKRIKNLQDQKVANDSRKKLHTEQLQAQTSTYKERYGVDLWGKNISEITAKVQAEGLQEKAALDKQVALSLQVVTLLESGDIKAARVLLGHEVEPEVAPEVAAPSVKAAPVAAVAAPVAAPVPVADKGEQVTFEEFNETTAVAVPVAVAAPAAVTAGSTPAPMTDFGNFDISSQPTSPPEKVQQEAPAASEVKNDPFDDEDEESLSFANMPTTATKSSIDGGFSHLVQGTEFGGF